MCCFPLLLISSGDCDESQTSEHGGGPGARAQRKVSLGVFQFFGLSSTSTSPLLAVILGRPLASAARSGEICVSVVPEPGSYVMVLGGWAAGRMIGVVGFSRWHRGASSVA